MPHTPTASSIAPYHLLIYSTLFGSQIYQTFIVGPISFRYLPRATFGHLQTHIFPIYLPLQTSLSALLYITFPSSLPQSPSSPPVTIPVALSFFTSLINLVVVKPIASKIMKERKEQEEKEGKKYWEEGLKSEEMKRLNKRFGAIHGVSSVLNLVGLFATAYYGVEVLGKKLVE